MIIAFGVTAGIFFVLTIYFAYRAFILAGVLADQEDYYDKVSKTNRERNSLIDQINCAFKVLIDTTTGLQSEMTLTADDLLGTGKNKFYKTEDT